MKAELIVYKILSFLLMPVAALLGLNCLAALLAALGNPEVLIVIFLFACITIYIIASYLFLSRGIDRNSPRKPVLRDWIRINAIVTFVFCLIVIPLLTGIKLQPSDAKMIMDQMETQNNIKFGVPLQQFQTMLSGFMTFIVVLCVVLVVHILITFHLMRQYRYLFEPGKMDIE